MTRVVVATIKPWNVKQFHAWSARTEHEATLITEPGELTLEKLETLQPELVFLPHWSHIIPREIFERFETLAFHMADLPDGRGGSPLQNQILRGVTHTQICAFRVGEGLDTGPVYLRRPICLEGAAEEIYVRASAIVFEMIEEILATRPEPTPQQGDVTTFRRRTPEQSRLPDGLSLPRLYDFIRMLDADGYPRAFVEAGGFRFSFSRASLRSGRLFADVEITESDDHPRCSGSS